MINSQTTANTKKLQIFIITTQILVYAHSSLIQCMTKKMSHNGLGIVCMG